MPQFVILHHRLPSAANRADHYDLMFDDGDALLTWAIVNLPSDEPQAADELPPHRREYLTYEGPVSHNRGHVARVVAGDFAWLCRDEATLVAAVESPALLGQLHWQRVDGKRWQLWFEKGGQLAAPR